MHSVGGGDLSQLTLYTLVRIFLVSLFVRNRVPSYFLFFCGRSSEDICQKWEGGEERRRRQR